MISTSMMSIMWSTWIAWERTNFGRWTLVTIIFLQCSCALMDFVLQDCLNDLQSLLSSLRALDCRWKEGTYLVCLGKLRQTTSTCPQLYHSHRLYQWYILVPVHDSLSHQELRVDDGQTTIYSFIGKPPSSVIAPVHTIVADLFLIHSAIDSEVKFYRSGGLIYSSWVMSLLTLLRWWREDILIYNAALALL